MIIKAVIVKNSLCTAAPRHPKKSLSTILFVWGGGGWGLAACKTCNRPTTDRKALEHPTPETGREWKNKEWPDSPRFYKRLGTIQATPLGIVTQLPHKWNVAWWNEEPRGTWAEVCPIQDGVLANSSRETFKACCTISFCRRTRVSFSQHISR